MMMLSLLLLLQWSQFIARHLICVLMFTLQFEIRWHNVKCTQRKRGCANIPSIAPIKCVTWSTCVHLAFFMKMVFGAISFISNAHSAQHRDIQVTFYCVTKQMTKNGKRSTIQKKKNQIHTNMKVEIQIDTQTIWHIQTHKYIKQSELCFFAI